MKKLKISYPAVLLAFIPAAVAAQSGTSVNFPAGYATSQNVCVKQVDGTCLPVSTTQPLPVTSSSATLPTNASTATNQTTANASLATIATAVTGTVAVSSAALPLPSGASTAANQTTSNTSLATIVTNTASNATSANQAASNTKLDILHTDMIAPTPAGTNLVGKVGIDQTTPGTTNAVDTVVKGTHTSRSAIVTTVATAQQLIAANTARRGFSIQNQSSGDCYINTLATATQDYSSLKIGSGGFYESMNTVVQTGTVSIICAVASAPIYAREW